MQNEHRAAFDWASDFDFFTRVAEHWKLGGVPQVLQQYRRHPSQATVEHRDEQVLEECAVRLLTAQRRAGREEAFASTIGELRQLRERRITAAEGYRYFANRALAEKLVVPAVYHGRRLVAVQRSAGSFCRAVAILLRAIASAPRRTLFLCRLFLTGPVRAHGLHDEGAGLSG